MGKKKRYKVVIHVPMDHATDEEALDHAMLAFRILKPLKPEGVDFVGNIYDVSQPGEPRLIPWSKP